MASRALTFSPFIVAYGDEGFYLDRDIVRARQGKRTVLQVDGGNLTDADLVEMCECGYEVLHTIIVDNAQDVKGTKRLTEFIEGRNVSDRSLILVAIVRDKKLPDVWALAASKGKKFERIKFKPWETDKHIDFIKAEANHQRVMIDKETALALFQYVGSDLHRLENELRKLAIYVGQMGAIQKEHIALITSPTPSVDPFQVAEQVMSKDLKKALSSFSVLYKNMGDNALIPVVYALMQQVEKTAIIRSLQDKDISEDEIAALVGMKEWPYKNIAAPIARKHDLNTIIKHMKKLCRLDEDVKSSAQSKRTLVELTMMSIAQSA